MLRKHEIKEIIKTDINTIDMLVSLFGAFRSIINGTYKSKGTFGYRWVSGDLRTIRYNERHKDIIRFINAYNEGKILLNLDTSDKQSVNSKSLNFEETVKAINEAQTYRLINGEKRRDFVFMLSKKEKATKIKEWEKLLSN